MDNEYNTSASQDTAQANWLKKPVVWIVLLVGVLCIGGAILWIVYSGKTTVTDEPLTREERLAILAHLKVLGDEDEQETLPLDERYSSLDNLRVQGEADLDEDEISEVDPASALEALRNQGNE